jgi:RNA polymerase sigma-70 factor (ECF subfamily)
MDRNSAGNELERISSRTIAASGPDRPASEALLAAGSASDEESFRLLTESFQREIHLHCYRMLGSVQDAEDALQETLLRAWRHRATFEARSAYRAWLYRIATNVCLTAATRRRIEPAPGPGQTDVVGPPGIEQIRYLTPYPDEWLDQLESPEANPAAQYDARESVQLAFLAAIQLLPPRQRAVLILRDVLGWSAAEAADLLESTTASVNSALQRARSTLDRWRSAGQLRTPAAPPNDVEQSLVRRYLDAWEAVDLDRLVSLLRADAVVTMPPVGLRFVGRRAIAEFFASTPYPGAAAYLRLVPTRVNRQPAFAGYRRDPAGTTYRATVIVVLTIDGNAIVEVTGFSTVSLLPALGLPLELV